MKCKNPQCNKILPDNALYCPVCGKKQTSAKKIIVVSVLIIALLALIILFFINSSVVKTNIAEIVEAVVEKVEDVVKSLDAEKATEIADPAVVEEVPKYELSRLNYENNVKTYKIDPSKKEFVDLGLPSGTLWATCNVGAAKPEEIGNYFAWGEVAPKFYYNSLTYKWWYDDVLTKYSNSGDTLEHSDDVAYVNWRGNWRMPTKAELEELCKYTICKIHSINGVEGYELTSVMNGNTIFFPTTGRKIGDETDMRFTDYWSSSLYGGDNALTLSFMSTYEYGENKAKVKSGTEWRYWGLPVRPVKRKK